MNIEKMGEKDTHTHAPMIGEKRGGKDEYQEGHTHTHLCLADVDHGKLVQREGEDVFVLFDFRLVLESLPQTLCERESFTQLTMCIACIYCE